MRQSQLFSKTLKNDPKEAEVDSHKLLLRGDFISQLASGIYSFLPLGCRVHKKIEEVVREEMDAIGGQEVFLPSLQPKEIWQKTDRWNHMDPPLFKIKDRHKKEFALGPTHEEAITDLLKNRVQSYKDLPVYLYQIQTKFRNEMRFTGGLLRAREFVMKDLYSFHSDKKDLDKFFNKVLSAYDKLFKRCGLKAIKSEASGGVFTKEKTYEFQVLSKIGEDRIIHCPECNWAANLEVAEVKAGEKCPKCKSKLVKANSIEMGHTFRLGTKYSEALNLSFRDKKGEKKPVVMGCYGIGLGRLMAAIVEINNDDKGIIWPKEVAPFDVHLVQIENSTKVKKAAEKIYQELKNKDVGVLYDDRTDIAVGEKFAEADLIGIPIRIVVSEKTLKNNSVEVKERAKGRVKLIKTGKLSQSLISKF
jgi:prolyl-tRNA synthetase